MPATAPTLRDIHLPAEPSWWPPAPGWWVLAVLLGIMLALLLRLILRRRRRLQRRAVILAELAALRPATLAPDQLPAFAAALSALLRRVSRAVRSDAATLRGQEWIAFLDRHGDGFAPYAQALTESAYRQRVELDALALFEVTQRHVKRVLTTELADV